jgi:NADH-quinone oxidoreductase subunit N
MLSILNEHYLIFTSLIILSFGIIYRFATHLNYPSIQTSINILAILSLVSVLAIVIIDTSIPSVLYNSLFVKDSSTLLVEIVTILIAIGIILTTKEYNKTNNIAQFEYTILLLFVLVSLHLLVAVEELFSFYLILEFQSICLYVLASLKKINIL